MIRRLCALLLCALLAAGSAFAAAEEVKTAPCTLLPLTEMDADAFWESADRRALFTILAVLDYAAHADRTFPDRISLFDKPSYVVRYGDQVVLMIRENSGRWMVIQYAPETKPDEIRWEELERMTDAKLRRSLDEGGIDYQKNDTKILMEVYTLMQNAVGK